MHSDALEREREREREREERNSCILTFGLHAWLVLLLPPPGALIVPLLRDGLESSIPEPTSSPNPSPSCSGIM